MPILAIRSLKVKSSPAIAKRGLLHLLLILGQMVGTPGIAEFQPLALLSFRRWHCCVSADGIAEFQPMALLSFSRWHC
jgi:hypothetical protein